MLILGIKKSREVCIDDLGAGGGIGKMSGACWKVNLSSWTREGQWVWTRELVCGRKRRKKNWVGLGKERTVWDGKERTGLGPRKNGPILKSLNRP
ncbi:hypothetical protein AKJ16_DCAP01669 [Drosera capensis]